MFIYPCTVNLYFSWFWFVYLCTLTTHAVGQLFAIPNVYCKIYHFHLGSTEFFKEDPNISEDFWRLLRTLGRFQQTFWAFPGPSFKNDVFCPKKNAIVSTFPMKIWELGEVHNDLVKLFFSSIGSSLRGFGGFFFQISSAGVELKCL